MKTLIHVNQWKIRAQRPNPITVKTYNSNREASNVAIVVDGEVVARVVYQPDKPLGCGAKVWIETQHEVVVESCVKTSEEAETICL